MSKLPLASDIAAIIPHYIDSVDRTIIITNAGEKISYTSRLRTVLKHIAYELCLDLYAIKKHTAKATQKVILHPLPLSPALLLIPLKVRIPSIQGQPSIGYVNFHSITNIFDENTANQVLPYRSSIELCGKSTLPVIWTCSTIKKQLRYARLSLAEMSIYPADNSKQRHNTESLLFAQKIMDFMNEILRVKRL